MYAAQAAEYEQVAAAAEGDKGAIGLLVLKNVVAPVAGAIAMRAGGRRYDLGAMASAAAAPDKGGLTRAGRALDKHGAGQRSDDSPFPAPRGNNQVKNEMGQQQVVEILNHPKAVFKELGRGGVSVRVPDGREIRYDANGRFSGFIESRITMAIKLNSGFEIAKFSDLQYEEMTVELRFNGVPIAEVNKDKGLSMLEIEMPSRFSPEGAQFLLPLDDFMEALRAAKELLVTL